MNYIEKILVGLIIVIVGLAVLEIVVDLLFDNASSIDTCLDAGGAWNYDLESCEKNK